MAHLGKEYPVALRRDWSTQLTSYRRAMARDYYCYSPSSFGTIGGHLFSNEVRMKEYQPLLVNILRWQMDATLINGRTVTGYLECTQTDLLGVMQWKAELFDSVQGSIAKSTGGQSAAFGYKSLAGRWDRSYVPRPALMSYGNDSLFNWNAVLWSDF